MFSYEYVLLSFHTLILYLISLFSYVFVILFVKSRLKSLIIMRLQASKFDFHHYFHYDYNL